MVKTSPNSNRYDDLKTNFNTYKNIIRRSITQAKKNYYHQTFKKYSNDLRKTWKTINETLNKNKTAKCLPQEFCLNNGNRETIVNEFNNYFVNAGAIVTDVQSNTPLSAFDTYLTDKPNCNFQFKEMTAADIFEIINSMKPKASSGIDELSNKILKHIQEVIVPPLTIIINQMLNTGLFPEKLKVSKVIPLYKKGDEHLFTNYRPISLLPSM